MIKILKYPSRKDWTGILRRPSVDREEIEGSVRKIVNKIRKNGDRALRKFTEKFDGFKMDKIELDGEEIDEGVSTIAPQLQNAIDIAIQNVRKFHNEQLQEEKRIETMPGISCWRRSVPIDKVGLYIPGGSAPLFSSIIMLGVPASIAGCEEIIMCTPPGKDGKIEPAMLYAAKMCGVKRIFRAGGAQAIAAMAYGTETIPRIQKIFGPGNSYVTEAKKLVQQDGIAIDLLAGPSEVLIIADQRCNPSYVAADLLSQAEHGKDSQVMLVTDSERIAEEVKAEIGNQLKSLDTYRNIVYSLGNSKIIVMKTIMECIEISNEYAPEHLILAIENAEDHLDSIRAAGSVFVGNYSPEAAGDYASGTNHTLPTNGLARNHSGVSVDSFMKKISFQKLTAEGLKNISETVMTMAEAERLPAHKNSIAIRLKP